MDKYQKAYAYLAGRIDEALSILDTGNLLGFGHVREILADALVQVEEYMISGTEFKVNDREELTTEAFLQKYRSILMEADPAEYDEMIKILQDISRYARRERANRKKI